MVTNGTNRHQEIPALRSYIEQQDDKKNTEKKQLYVFISGFSVTIPATTFMKPSETLRKP
ncbi:hypothetical protein DC094_13555 [Pelagibaculum spongiae]|uniref:Uncharacterized protein n=1 Tax=Pelagibaculum spongiae TaxID=2080658 RepID=A0A2V1GWI5_9GAMM|nr:hypothetical protein DC094_13555 [Pelagibaculum spongiae]